MTEVLVPQERPTPWLTPPQGHLSASELIAQAESLVQKLEDPRLKKLAATELAEFTKARTENSAATREAFTEFSADLAALKRIEDHFHDFPHREEFVSFFASGSLSDGELEAFLAFVDSQWPRIKKQVAETGLPCTRESYTLFADRFGLPTSTTTLEKRSDGNEAAAEKLTSIARKLEAIPQGISGELDTFRRELAALTTLDPASAEFRAKSEALDAYLLGANPETVGSGALERILRDLKTADQQAVTQGERPKNYDIFARTMRDFSPDVARRIDAFEAHTVAATPKDGEPASTYQRAIVEAGLPVDATPSMKDATTFEAISPDGTQVQIVVDGTHISRSLKLEGVDYPLETPVEQAALSDALAELESVRQNEGSKLARVQHALSFLQNPEVARIPLADLQRGLLKLLGFELYNALDVRNATDTPRLIAVLQGQETVFHRALTDAEQAFAEKKAQAVLEARKKYEQHDRQTKETLTALKLSGLWALGLDFLIRSIEGNLVTPQIGLPVDPQNFDPAQQHFGEAGTHANSPRAHFEYLYRIANKILTGSPDGMVDGTLRGFSLDQAKLRPDVAQKTDAELKLLMQEAGVWHQDRGANRAEILKRLSAPLPEEQDASQKPQSHQSA